MISQEKDKKNKSDISPKKRIAIRGRKKNEDTNLLIYDLEGNQTGNINLPPQIFKTTINEKLMAQTVRVYLFNQRQGTASTKTRGEVAGSTRKIYRQKGTGRARHGDIKAPIFVGGGVVGGPKPKDFSLKINKKQNKKSIISALSFQFKNENIIILDDEALKIDKPKTKIINRFLEKLGLKGKKVLFILPKLSQEFILSLRNIPKTDFIEARMINTYQILNCHQIIIFESAIDEIKKIFQVTH
ncbi:MAG: 50S ribosomal protein L4 [Patescibacteria group bacterium]|nr:50S ribosomal protein L4 [Patescibacteria group bacterium]